VRHVAPLLAELAARHPGLEIDAAYSDRRVDLIAERFDAAIRIGMLQDSSLVGRRIAPVSGAVVASPGYLDRHGRPTKPEELAGHECIIYAGTAERAIWRFRSGRRWVSVRPEGRVRADSGDAILATAVAGLGIATLPTFLAAEAIERGDLEVLLRDYPMPEAAIHVVRPPGPHVPGKLRVLIDAMVERFGGVPHWDACQMHALRAADRVEVAPAPG
jgi:DNA-binding transcriptional LysR family regulator